MKRTYTDSEVRYFLAKSAIALGLPSLDRRLMDGWERFVAWRLAAPYANCLKGLQPRSTHVITTGNGSCVTSA